LLSGIVVAFLLSAITQLMLLAKPDIWRSMQSFLFGSTGFISWSSVGLLGTVFGLSIVPAVLLSRGLDALTLGEDTAQSLGLSLPALRLTLLGIVSLATAAAVGEVGVVGFVGLVAPHLVRETLSVNHRQLLIAAPLCGGALLQAADLASRWLIRPAELPVGAVTACVGGSYLVYLLWRRSRNA
jgi:iron complex transport system permease protein